MPPAWWYAGGFSVGVEMRISTPFEAVLLGFAALTMASGALAQSDPSAAQRLIVEGNADLKAHNYDAAIAAYTRAMAADHTSIASFNLCAVHYNLGHTDGALAACDQAIADDPGRADAYFIKGSLLVASANMVNGKLVAPREALNKYLELAPNGPHAADVKQMLDLLK